MSHSRNRSSAAPLIDPHHAASSARYPRSPRARRNAAFPAARFASANIVSLSQAPKSPAAAKVKEEGGPR